MSRIELTDLEREKLADAGRGFMAKHRSAQEIEIAELKNALAMARQKKTLRDEFAMATLGKTEFFCRASGENYYITDKDEMVKLIWEVADAMMQERGK